MRNVKMLSLAITLAASAAMACDGHYKAEATKADAHQDCCAAKTTKTASATAARPGDAVAAVNVETPGANCPHAAKGAKAEGQACPHAAKAKIQAMGGTPDAKKAVLTSSNGKAGVDAAGKILCAKCDLNQAASCASVFQAANRNYKLCSGGLTDQIRKLTQHGELEVTVRGQLVSDTDGSDMLCLDGFSVGTI